MTTAPTDTPSPSTIISVMRSGELESVAIDTVGAVTDDQYGWAREPPIEERDDQAHVMVKFPREKLVDRLGTGEHEPTVVGVVDGTIFRGSTPVEVFQPGNGGGGRGNGRNGN